MQYNQIAYSACQCSIVVNSSPEITQALLSPRHPWRLSPVLGVFGSDGWEGTDNDVIVAGDGCSAPQLVSAHRHSSLAAE